MWKLQKQSFSFFDSQSGSLKPIVVVLNLGKTWQTINLSAKYGLPESLKVVVASIESQYVEGLAKQYHFHFEFSLMSNFISLQTSRQRYQINGSGWRRNCAHNCLNGN